jgi:hypothetical protein
MTAISYMHVTSILKRLHMIEQGGSISHGSLHTLGAKSRTTFLVAAAVVPAKHKILVSDLILADCA